MKTSIKYFSYLALLIGVLTACEKGTLIEQTVVYNPTSDDIKLKILLLAPGAPSVNFYLNNTKITGVYSAVGVEAGYGYNGLYPDLGYLIINPTTTYQLQAKVANSAATDAGLVVFDQNMNFENGKSYSFISSLYNTTTKTMSTYTLLEDVRPPIDTSKVFVRVVNLLNNKAAINYVQTTSGQVIAQGLPYGQATEFIAINNPGKANSYAPVNPDTGTNLVTATSYTLTKGRCYTAYVYGIFGNTTYPPKMSYYTTFY